MAKFVVFEDIQIGNILRLHEDDSTHLWTTSHSSSGNAKKSICFITGAERVEVMVLEKFIQESSGLMSLKVILLGQEISGWVRFWSDRFILIL